jgi:Tol biopolymer transport system component/predicted Ser/Thr protein kinase
MIGQTIGSYRITAKLGAGGMGEVYRATDRRLGREVAIKFSAERFSERFEREARAIAALNHPNICHLYDVGPNYLVMELVEGSPLKGPLPLEKAVEYAGQILDALDAAHRKGITHRDLKPANILVTKQGIKLLDFGLAKQKVRLGEDEPTKALTDQGQIIGTLQYMSPEQLQGKEADARSDLFAFGCVLYEMLTGKWAFEGASAASIIAAILEREPAPLNLSPPLERVIRTCLVKDPEQRFQTALDLKRALLWAIEPQPNGIVIRRGSRWWQIVAAAALLLAVLFFVLWSGRAPAAAEVVSFAIYPPEKTAFSPPINTTVSVPQFALSPDGRTILFVAGSQAGRPMLWVRPLEQVNARTLAGTEDAQHPFWSPDGRWIGFFAEGKLKKIPATGGAVQVVTQTATDFRGGTWGPDDTIVFASGTGPLFRVASAGGRATPASAVAEGSNRFPQFLPDGRHFLHIALSSEQSGIYAGSLDDKSMKLLVRTNTSAVYAPPGYLLLVDGDTLLGQALDAKRREVSGQPFLIAEHVGRSSAFQSAISASRVGSIAYAGTIAQNGRLTWFDRGGKALGSAGPEGDYADFRLSPTEKLLAASLVDSKTGTVDIWMHDLARGSNTRTTRGGLLSASAIWSPDGTQLVFRALRRGLIEFYRRSAAGGGNEESVLATETERAAQIQSINLVPTDWSPDGRHIVFSYPEVASGNDLWLLPLTGDRKPFRFLASPSEEMHGNFSPDGHFIAYSSNESGKFEVYVQTFPLSDRKWQVSTDGGYEPRWRADGREIYYLSEDRKLMAVSVGADPSFDVPKSLFQTRVPAGVTANRTHYVPSRDGQRFLVNTQSGDPSPTPITVVLNWTAGLKK